MKRSLALAALLLASSACTTTTTENTNTGSVNTNTNAAAAATTPAAAGPTQADIETKERQIWDAIKAKNWDAFSGLLADDLVFVSEEGVSNKTQAVEAIKKFDMTEYNFTDLRLIKVDADLVVLTYTSTEKSSYDGKPTPNKPLRNSSVWAGRGGKWIAVYHQESRVVEMPPPPPTPATAASPAASPASPAASPAASPSAIASATDAEKAVWEAIKTKHTDLFASYLLPDAVEVEPEGVMDRATSAKMIGEFDASKWSLSDFKETKLDADATLLTYKTAGSERGKQIEMYHTTLWTNRGGQWKAAFHQGTYAAKSGM